MPLPGSTHTPAGLAGMLETSGGWFPARVTVEEASETLTDSGQVARTWEPILEDLPARVSPLDLEAWGSRQQLRRDDDTITKATHRVRFSRRWPITTAHRLRVDDDTFEVITAGADSDGLFTGLLVEKIT